MYRPEGFKNTLTLENRMKEHNDFEDVGDAFEAVLLLCLRHSKMKVLLSIKR